jgi:hypothetical protein
MLFEILLLLLLARGLGSIVADKGYARLPFQLLLFALSLGGQLVCCILFMVLLGGRSGASVLGDSVDLCFIYLGGIIGGGLGAFATFLVAINLGDKVAVDLPGLDLPADATAKFTSRFQHTVCTRFEASAGKSEVEELRIRE